MGRGTRPTTPLRWVSFLDPPYNYNTSADGRSGRSAAEGGDRAAGHGAFASRGANRFRGLHTGRQAFTIAGKRWRARVGRFHRQATATFRAETGKDWGATDLSPDDKVLAAAIESPEGKIDFWDISSNKRTFSIGRGYYALVRLSPDGKLLAAYSTAFADRAVVELWDVASQRKLRAWKPHGRQQVLSLAFSANSRKLLTSGGEGKARLWDTKNGQQLQEFTRLDWKPGSFFSFQAEALSPDGKLVALLETNEKCMTQTGAIAWKARISLRDAATGKQVRLLTCPSQEVFPGQATAFSALAFTPDGKNLLTGGPDHFLRVWDSATGSERQRWPLVLGRPYSLTPSRDGKMLAAVMRDGKAIQLVDMASGKPLPSPAGHLASVYLSALTPTGRTAVTVGNDSNLLLWDVATSRIRRVLKGHEDGSLLRTPTDSRRTHAVHGRMGQDRAQFGISPRVKSSDDSRWGENSYLLDSAHWRSSPDGGTLAVLSSTKTIRIFDTTSDRELRRFEGPEWIMGSAFSADGRSLIVCSGDLKVRIWDTTNGRQLREYPLPQELRIGQPISLDFPARTDYNATVSPDGRLLADRQPLAQSAEREVFPGVQGSGHGPRCASPRQFARGRQPPRLLAGRPSSGLERH